MAPDALLPYRRNSAPAARDSLNLISQNHMEPTKDEALWGSSAPKIAESEGSTCATGHGLIHVCHFLAYPLEAVLDTPQTNMEPTQGVRFPKGFSSMMALLGSMLTRLTGNSQLCLVSGTERAKACLHFCVHQAGSGWISASRTCRASAKTAVLPCLPLCCFFSRLHCPHYSNHLEAGVSLLRIILKVVCHLLIILKVRAFVILLKPAFGLLYLYLLPVSFLGNTIPSTSCPRPRPR